MKQLLSFFIAAAILVSCDPGNGKVDPGKDKPSGGETIPVNTLEPGQLKVMSFNIRQQTTEVDAWNHWSLRSGSCKAMVIDQKPTILGLQELAETQWNYMCEGLSRYGYTGVATQDVKNAFMYRRDILEYVSGGNFWLTDTPDVPSVSSDGFSRYVKWAIMKITATGQSFFFMNTHFGLTTQSRKTGMNVIINRLPKYNTENLPVVFIGDCNTLSTDSLFDEFRKTMVCTRDVAPITDNLDTYNGWNLPDNRPYVCDHIFITSSIACSEYKTVTQPYEGHTLISDHYPVYSIIKF